MRTIIAGSRHCSDYFLLLKAISESGFESEITEVVSGCATGVDSLGEKWAAKKGLPIKKFPALWSEFGKSAGPIRNSKMAQYAEALIAIQFTGSRGTADMVAKAKKFGLKVYVKEMKE